MESRQGAYERRASSDMLPVHYHYLMFAHNQLGEIDDAVKMAKTYLMFHPTNEQMIQNLELLQSQASDPFIQEDETANKFYKQAMKEVAMLEYMEKWLNLEFDFAIKNPFPGNGIISYTSLLSTKNPSIFSTFSILKKP